MRRSLGRVVIESCRVRGANCKTRLRPNRVLFRGCETRNTIGSSFNKLSLNSTRALRANLKLDSIRADYNPEPWDLAHEADFVVLPAPSMMLP